MLKRYNFYLDAKDVRELERIGQRKGGLKLSQMIRLAISEYIRLEKKGNQ